MSRERTFIQHAEIGLREWGTDGLDHGRLKAHAPIVLQDLDDPAITTKPGAAEFSLMTAGDVSGLVPSAITRRFPAPGSSDAEQPKAALIEFAAADLLWRYTPSRPGPQTNAAGAPGQGLKPWLVLVVGGATELSLAPDGTVAIAVSAQQNHPLDQSWMWAHIQHVDGHDDIGRIISPLPLEPNTLYRACLVPGFVVAAGQDMAPAWNATVEVRLPCYDHWSFTTGDKGDFPELAEQLRARSYEDLEPDFGIGKVRYSRRGPGSPDHVLLGMEGALARIPSDPAQEDPVVHSAHQPVDAWVAAEVSALSQEVPVPPGRWILSAPHYQEPYLGRDPPPDPGWGKAMVEDPRRRAAAGLGAWNAIAWQDKIADAAALLAGDVLTAQDRIGHLGLGLEAAGSLWRRHVPDDPAGRLAVLSPVLGRLPERSGGTALDAVAGRARLTRALFSSAARRALRPGTARAARAAPDAADPREVLITACRCPKLPPEPAPGDPSATLRSAVEAAARGDEALADRVLVELGESPSPDLLAAVLAAMDPGGRRPPDLETLDRLLQRVLDPPPLPDRTGEGKQPACRDVDPAALGTLVAAAVDPTVERPLVVDRVLATLPGLTDLRPPMLEPEIDMPLWSFLRDGSPDWLLPGVGNLPLHSVVGVATNPAFVQALLLGANYQTAAELRWRRHPLLPKASPLRKFWQRTKDEFDIEPIKGWVATDPFGGPSLTFAGAGQEAVAVFRTPLFKRYPHTVVYMYPAAVVNGVWDESNLTTLDPNLAVPPTFTGTIGDDVVFFGFPLPAAAFNDHWIVLEEPPAGYRFYNIPPDPSEMPGVDDPSVVWHERDAATDASIYAYDSYALPVRVMIGQLPEGDA
ncbi:MAG TPA: hypothetical protein VFH80_34285 [Solirubrobacteraceae bacterium]|nr:hypothetical protein [Solirubrobacteraceae bacterium]